MYGMDTKWPGQSMQVDVGIGGGTAGSSDNPKVVGSRVTSVPNYCNVTIRWMAQSKSLSGELLRSQ